MLRKQVRYSTMSQCRKVPKMGNFCIYKLHQCSIILYPSPPGMPNMHACCCYFNKIFKRAMIYAIVLFSMYGNLERILIIFTFKIHLYLAYGMYPDKRNFEDENVTDSQVTAKFTQFTSLKNYHISIHQSYR